MAKRTRVSIVGGGIAGLALAAALDPTRCQVTLHEAEPDRAASGSALTLWPAATRALRRLGAGELVDRHTHRVSGGTIRDLRTSRRLLPTASARLTIVPRPDLLAALEACVPASVQREHVQVDDPQALEADVVVGADGVRSRVRALVRRSRPERTPTSYLALRGLSDRVPQPDEVGEYWGRGRLFGLVPLAAGAYWFTTHRSTLGPEPIDPGEALAEVRDVFTGTAAAALQVLATARAEEVVATRLWVAPGMARYARGRYVLIGDAAHAMTPNLGRGAGDAIIDAVTLAPVLGSRLGTARWQARRLPFTQGARIASGGVMQLALSGQPQRLLGKA
ncbi:FAD-dependent monooxygenase [Ornithinimicrobium murale]|uniref:FAD-dependent monooxygenase n=1 Tax=Ornithinimicrobium murale TaxID=1050153 RepID=UPI000E0D7A18|nr:NAD(P)/FAD-dependent oxidoreductase [Ornithinimicrobium murale]